MRSPVRPKGAPVTVDRDELWVDMAQFDTRLADGVWDGEAADPDAPRWVSDLRALVHRARGPAEPHELIDEPTVVDSMRRATLGETLAELPHRPGVRALGRVVAMKAAAATTASVMTVAAAAATTGLVATMAATVVVPVIHERVMPIIRDEAEAPVEIHETPASPSAAAATTHPCGPQGDVCIVAPGDRPVVKVPAPDPAVEPAIEPATVAPAPAEPAPAVEPVPEPEPVVAAPVEPPAETPPAVTTEPPPEPPAESPTTTTTEPEPPAPDPQPEPAVQTEPPLAESAAAEPAFPGMPDAVPAERGREGAGRRAGGRAGRPARRAGPPGTARRLGASAGA